MKKNGSRNANASVAKNTVEEDVEHPLLGVLGADLHDLLACPRRDAFVDAVVELDVRLDELDRAVGAGGDRLHATRR